MDTYYKWTYILILCIDIYNYFERKKLLLLEFFILDSILKILIKDFANNNICKNII